MTSALSLLQPAPCHRHHCFASVWLCFIGLLIVPSIFFKEVDRLAFDSSVFLWFYSLQDDCPKSLKFCPNGQYGNHFSITPHYKFFIAKYGIVNKSLSASIEVQERSNIWPNNYYKTVSDCFSRSFLRELSELYWQSHVFPRYSHWAG